MERFPFIVGCGRSGTTLVRAILDSHPDLAVPGESYFVVWLGRDRRRYQRPRGFDGQRFVSELVSDAWFRRWGLPEAEVRSALDAAHPASFAEAVRATYALYARHQGKARYGDKTPTYVLHLGLIAELLPEAVFVHVVRDGRDVALSLLEADWGPRTLEDAALHWKLHVEQGRRQGRALGPGRYREIRYEDLLDDPARGAAVLADFAGLGFDDAMLAYGERAASVLAGLPDPHEHQNLRLPPTKGLRAWRSEMTAGDVASFEALAGDLLDQLGYPREWPELSVGQQAEALRHRLRWRARRAGRRTRTLVARLAGR